MVGPKPVPLTTPFTMMSPPPAVVVNVLAAFMASAKLMVCKLVLLFVTLAPSVMALPLRTKAPAPELNVIPKKVELAAKSLVLVNFVFPLNATRSADVGAVPAQFPPVLQFESAPPPLQVIVAPMMDCAIVRSARTRGIVVMQLRWLRSLE